MGKKVATADDLDAYSVEEFCRRHSISAQTFYKYPDDMPVSFPIGTRRLITREAAARWRAKKDADAEAQSAPSPAPQAS